VSEAIDLIGHYQDAGVQLLINSDYRNNMETLELFASEIMPSSDARRNCVGDYRQYAMIA
jgi:hypothetical protein